MAYDTQTHYAKKHYALTSSAPIAGIEPSRKHLAVYAGQLAFKSGLRRLRRHPETVLRRLEQNDGAAGKHQVNRNA